jgi:tetratricopeptide (TPR) repeat protein
MNKSSDIESEEAYPEEYEGQGSNTFYEKQYEGQSDGINEIIFTQLEQMAKNNIELRNFDQGFEDIDRCIEQLLVIIPEGINSSGFQDYMTRTLNYLNDYALKLLQIDQVRDSIKILEKCQNLSQPDKYGVHPILRNLTYNHLGCCYRRIGKLEKSLYYLEKAEQLLIYVDKAEGSGVTHINMCAVLSQMGK